MYRLLSFVFLALFVSLLGCGGDGLIGVSGPVTFNGKSIDKGTIAFVGDSGTGTVYGGQFQNGHYSVRVAPGTYLVRINGLRTEAVTSPPAAGASGIPMSAPKEQTVQYLPAEFNFTSKLTAEIPAKNTVIEFTLTGTESTGSAPMPPR